MLLYINVHTDLQTVIDIFESLKIDYQLYSALMIVQMFCSSQFRGKSLFVDSIWFFNLFQKFFK